MTLTEYDFAKHLYFEKYDMSWVDRFVETLLAKPGFDGDLLTFPVSPKLVTEYDDMRLVLGFEDDRLLVNDYGLHRMRYSGKTLYEREIKTAFVDEDLGLLKEDDPSYVDVGGPEEMLEHLWDAGDRKLSDVMNVLSLNEYLLQKYREVVYEWKLRGPRQWGNFCKTAFSTYLSKLVTNADDMLSWSDRYDESTISLVESRLRWLESSREGTVVRFVSPSDEWRLSAAKEAAKKNVFLSREDARDKVELSIVTSYRESNWEKARAFVTEHEDEIFELFEEYEFS